MALIRRVGMYCVTARNVSKVFQTSAGARPVLSGVNLEISQGQIAAIRGDNGSGKTTLLNIIAGIEKPTEGLVATDGIAGEPIRIGYVQQDYSASLLPWYTALDNICLPLRLLHIPQKARIKVAEKLLEELGFVNLPLENRPGQLSGGQKQRVAIARALIHNPHLILLDEPFANLDAHTSRDLQETLSRLHRQRPLTIILVSHEIDQCLYMADTVYILHGSPATITRSYIVPIDRPRRRPQILTHQFEELRRLIIREEEELFAASK